ncbi:MAG: class II aldolase/adducin family protein [Planctomycetes bacterium]|nr:class II aldolase/adducin family protein [Planctomycetota bacterium]
MNGNRMDEEDLRQFICEIGRRMYEREYVVSSDGNISTRLTNQGYLFTPTGCCLGEIEPEDVVATDGDGNVREGEGEPTAEWRLHLVTYGLRPDIGAVVHAHPPWVLAASAAGFSLARPVLPEVLYHIGSIPTADYAIPSSEESAQAIRGWISDHDAVVMDRHGCVTVDKTLRGAYRKLERVEQTARLVVRVKTTSVLKILPRNEVEKIRERRRADGMNPESILPDPSWEFGEQAESDYSSPEGEGE